MYGTLGYDIVIQILFPSSMLTLAKFVTLEEQITHDVAHTSHSVTTFATKGEVKLIKGTTWYTIIQKIIY